MENKRTRLRDEEQLREAAYLGDRESVQELINSGVDVNARHSVNGWTALHWACKQGNIEIASLLLSNGANQNIISIRGETPASLCTSQPLLQLLSMTNEQKTLNEPTSASVLHNFLPPLTFKNETLSTVVDTSHIGARASAPDETQISTNYSSENELVLKIRIANTPDPDFIEVELPRSNMTFETLVRVCCEELNLSPDQILKLRKLPNTKLRKDKDIQRLRNFEEIEVVTDSVPLYKLTNSQNSNGVPAMPTVPANGYQSMSKKDQVILY